MSKPSSLFKYLAAFIGGALVLSSALYVYMILGALGFVWTPYTCLTDVLGQTSGPAGHFSQVSESSCSGVGKGPAYISVFASKAKGQRKSLIFKYEAMHDGSRDAEPVITFIEDRTVRISVKHVAMIVCRSRRWDTLAIEYDIGRIVVEAYDGPSDCTED